MFYYKYRYTFSPELQELKDPRVYIRILTDMLAELDQYMLDKKFTAGIETEGELAHLHVHFTSEKSRGTIATQLVRKFFIENETRKVGNKIYSLKAEADVDEKKFYRYPLKEKLFKDLEFKKLHIFKGFTQEEYLDMNNIAHEQNRVAKQVNDAKQNRKDPVSWWDKISAYLNKCETIPSTYQETYLHLLEFYIQNDKPLDHQQIQRYSYLYLLKENKLTLQQYFNINH